MTTPSHKVRLTSIEDIQKQPLVGIRESHILPGGGGRRERGGG